MLKRHFDKLESLVGRFARYQRIDHSMAYIFIVAFVRPSIYTKFYTTVYGMSYTFSEDGNRFNILVKRGVLHLGPTEVDSMKAITQEEFENVFYTNCDCQMRFDNFFDRALTDYENIYSNNPLNDNKQ